MNKAQELEAKLQSALGQVVFGAEHIVHALVIALVGKGHILLEGPPGLGKTLLGRAFTASLGGQFKRIQGTADLMPSDITGVHVFDTQKGDFVFHPGPVFADVVLMDEINRAGPKTQSALLEAMEERQVTIDRESFRLAYDFLVIATQNPREYEGTFPLPESQLDRFMLKVSIDYPDRQAETRIIDQYVLPGSGFSGSTVSTVDAGAVQAARDSIAEVHLAEELVAYCLDLAAATRQSEKISLGLSSRGVLALVRSARIEAALRGGEYVVPDDVKETAAWVLSHRIALTPEAELDGVDTADEIGRILDALPVNL